MPFTDIASYPRWKSKVLLMLDNARILADGHHDMICVGFFVEQNMERHSIVVTCQMTDRHYTPHPRDQYRILKQEILLRYGVENIERHVMHTVDELVDEARLKKSWIHRLLPAP